MNLYEGLRVKVTVADGDGRPLWSAIVSDPNSEKVSSIPVAPTPDEHSRPVSEYQPIAELPIAEMRNVVFWNSCNGPYFVRLLLEEQAAEYRDHDAWTHFTLLPPDPPRERSQNEL